MKTIWFFFSKFLLGLLVGTGFILIFYCLTLPAKPFVYVGF